MKIGDFVWKGAPHTAPSMRDNEPPALLSRFALPLCSPALLSLACMFGEALKTNEKESYMTQKIEISDIGIPDTPPPPPTPTHP